MLQNAYLLAKICADTAENEQHFAEILPTDALWRLRRRVVEALPGRRVEAVLEARAAEALADHRESLEQPLTFACCIFLYM